MEIGFDNEKYLNIQREKILERIKMFDNKLYLEFGGKLFDDYHASRVLPGFKPDSKIQLLQTLKDDLEIIFCINANDVQKSKIRADYGISYDAELLRLIDNFKKLDISINSVVITMYQEQKSIGKLMEVLENRGIKVYLHRPTEGYPNDVEKIVSEDGYGKNPYIETSKKLVVVTAPGPNSGKLGTCLSQLYHEHKRGVKAGYAKFETFPVWNLPLKHPVNVAYEAATADLEDINIIDSYHLEAYNIKAVNYNRDIATFPILKNILFKIMGNDIYKSPTDMGVNMIKECITDDKIVEEAAKMEVIRRYYQALCDLKMKMGSEKAVSRIEVLLKELNLSKEDRKVAIVAMDKSEQEKKNVVAMVLPNGKIITGKESELLSAPSALFLNAIKEITNVPDDAFLLSPTVLQSIFKMKTETSYKQNYCLNLPEVLIVLSICSQTNPIIENAISNLSILRGCDAHSSYILKSEEAKIIKNLGISLTCEPRHSM